MNQTLKMSRHRKLKPKVFLLIGPPNAGKTTWRNNYLRDDYAVVISRDDTRMECFGPHYKQNSADENIITQVVDQNKRKYTLAKEDIIVDETHCNMGRLKQTILFFSEMGYHITLVTFELPFWRQRWRNFWRKLRTGKDIPKDVSKKMHKAFYPINMAAETLGCDVIRYKNGKWIGSNFIQNEYQDD